MKSYCTKNVCTSSTMPNCSSIKFCLEDKEVIYRIDFNPNRVVQVTDDGELPVSHITFDIIEDGQSDDEEVDEHTVVKYIGFSDYELKIYIKN